MASRRVTPMERPGVKPMVASGLTVSQDYLDAVKLLSPDTMSSACTLVQSDAPESLEKLLALYSKCQKAVDVVVRDAPKDMPKLPGLAKRDSITKTTATAARPSTITLKRGPLTGPLGSVGKMTGPAKAMAVSKGRMIRPSAVPMRGKISSRLDIHTQAASESSLDNSAMKQRGGIQKLQRVATGPQRPPSPTQATGPVQASGKVTPVPPPSALSFLAKLNKERPSQQENNQRRRPLVKNGTKEASTTQESSSSGEEEESDDDSEMKEAEPVSLPKEQPTRSQPTRSSRRR